MAGTCRFLAICLLLSLFLNNAVAHVALTFPPARKLDLDFLDYFHSKPPCGMPKGGFQTCLKAGSTINVTWHMGLPHPGGYRIELLDKDEKVTMKLTEPSSKEMYINGNILVQSHVVQLPDMDCMDCTIRLLRAATQIKDYGYWSCADVSIVKADKFMENCLGHGKPDANGNCVCDSNYWGSKCQYKDECVADMDCGSGNKCVDLGGTNLPRKQCFCTQGSFGEKCQMKNSPDMPTPHTLKLSKYTKAEIEVKTIQVLWRMIEDKPEKEVEFVIQVVGTSYVALGWRPAELDESCMQMPAIDEASAMAHKGFELNEMLPFKLEKKNTPWVTKFMLHPMVCTDVVVGAAHGMHTRIRDYYNRDLSTPRLDTIYGGKEDLTGATGWEKDGMTTIIFRRKVKTMDPTDHPLMGKMHFIWARGQEVEELPETKGFYTHDELKYHGMAGDQRGVFAMTFP